MAQTFEFCTVIEHTANGYRIEVAGENQPADSTLPGVFNRLGAEGWQLVMGWPDQKSARHIFHFQRQITSSAP